MSHQFFLPCIHWPPFCGSSLFLPPKVKSSSSQGGDLLSVGFRELQICCMQYRMLDDQGGWIFWKMNSWLQRFFLHIGIVWFLLPWVNWETIVGISLQKTTWRRVHHHPILNWMWWKRWVLYMVLGVSFKHCRSVYQQLSLISMWCSCSMWIQCGGWLIAMGIVYCIFWFVKLGFTGYCRSSERNQSRIICWMADCNGIM